MVSIGRGDRGGDDSCDIIPGDELDDVPSFVLNDAREMPDAPEMPDSVRLNAGGIMCSIGDDATVWFDAIPREF